MSAQAISVSGGCVNALACTINLAVYTLRSNVKSTGKTHPWGFPSVNQPIELLNNDPVQLDIVMLHLHFSYIFSLKTPLAK